MTDEEVDEIFGDSPGTYPEWIAKLEKARDVAISRKEADAAVFITGALLASKLVKGMLSDPARKA